MIFKKTKIALKFLATFSLIFVVGFSNLTSVFLNHANPYDLGGKLEIPSALAAPTNNGQILYSNNSTTPQSKDYTASTNTFGAQTATVAGAAQTFTVSRASATRSERIAGYVTTGGVLYIMRWNGTAWSNEWNVIVGGNGVDGRRFDIAYEKTSGRAMVAYSTNSTGATGNEIAYRIWDGATWTAAVNINSARFTQAAAVTSIKMKANPLAGSNEIALTAQDTGTTTANTSVLTSFVWNGAGTWTEPAAAHTTATTTFMTNTTGQLVQNDAFDLAYESLSGDILVTFSTGGTAQQWYATRTAGTWAAATSFATGRAAPLQMIAESNPYTDQIMIVFNRSASTNVYGRIWSGTAMGTNTTIGTTGVNPTAIEKKHITGKWLRVGTTDYAVAIWNSSTAGTFGRNYFTGAAWGTAATYVTGTGVTANWLDSDLDPQGPDTMMLTFSTGAAGTGSLWAKRLVLSAGPTFTFTNADGGAALSTTLASVTSQNFDFEYTKFVPPIITIGATAGPVVANLNSGDLSQFANAVGCTSAANCSALTLSATNASVTINSIKITTTGTVNSTNDLSNLALFYDTTGNYSAGGAVQFGTTVANFTAGAATVSGSLVLTPGTTYYFYVRYDLINGANNPAGAQTIGFQIAANTDITFGGSAIVTGAPAALSGVTTVKPQITTYTNATEPALNYVAACTNCGARIGPGVAFRQSVTVTGYGFGTLAAGSRSTATNNIMVGTKQIADANVTAWTPTSISLNTDSAVVGDTDLDWGANFGGASALTITVGAQPSFNSLNFYVLPQITSLSVPVSFPADSAREFDAADTDGVVTLNGTRFGSTQGTGVVTFTIGVDVARTATANSWNNTAAQVQVPASIADNVYAGGTGITLTQGTGGNANTAVYASLRVLPRILSNTPTSGSVGATIQILGNHFCQTGACPVSPNRSTVTDNLVFGTTQALDTDFKNLTGGAGACNGAGAAWTHAEICANVPVGTPGGSQPTKLTSNSFTSNTKAFSTLSTIPSDPINLQQFKADGVSPMAIGGGTNATTVKLAADLSASISINMILEVEAKPIGTAFNGTVTASSTPACVGLSCTNQQATVSGLVSGTEYHWRARTKNTTTQEVSGWVAFGNNPVGNGSTDGVPANRDFFIDTTPPVISGVGTPPACTSHINITDIDGTITWGATDTFNAAQILNFVQYGTDSTLTAGTTLVSAPAGTTPSIKITGLTPSTVYYYWVKSVDSVGNINQTPSAGPFCSFTTSAPIVRSMKTIEYFAGQLDQISVAGTSTSTVPVYIAEPSPTIKNAYVEVNGLVTGSAPSLSIALNGQAPFALNLPASVNAQFFTVRYNIPSLSISCTAPVSGGNAICTDGVNANNLALIFGGTFNNFSLVNARIVITYFYTP